MITSRLAHLGPLFATGLLGLLAFALVAPTARAQEASIEVVSVAHDPAGSLTVTLTGDAASQVDAASLEASIEGVDLGAATEVDAGSAPPPTASIVILIETSSSADFGVLDRAKASALALVDELNPQDRVAVVSMGDSADVVSGFTTDRVETRAAIEGLSLGFFAGIFSGVGTAADLIAPEPGPKAVVALGWGWDFGGASTISRTAATEAAAASGAAYYWVPLGFDWDAAFFNGLMTANGGRQLGEAEVPQVARELAPASEQQRVFRFSTPVLGRGERTLTLTAAGEQLAVPFEVDNTGLLAIESVEAGAPGEPIVVTLGGALPASQLAFEATLAGEALPVEASASALRIDPWAFAPGDSELVVTVRGAGGEAARATAPITIPSLDPQLTLAEVADADSPSVAAAWRVQNDPGAHLEVRVAGEVVADTMEPGIIVQVPEGASVTAAILSADGAELASESFSMPAAATSGDGTSIPTSYFVLAAVLLSSATAIYLLRKTVKRRPRPPEFDFGSLFAPLGGVFSGVAGRFRREGGSDATTVEDSDEMLDAAAQVLVRTPDGDERRVPVRNEQLSVGASRQCDVTLSGGDVRFVHLILTAIGDDSYRVFRFGPVTHDETGEDVEDDAVVRAGEWVRVGGYAIAVEADATAFEAA